MITKVLTNNELKNLAAEIFFNKQTKATKITDESVVNALLFGMSRAGQAAMKDVSLVESVLLPQSATSTNLDKSVKLFGGLERYTVSGSSTYILLVADQGTVYSSSLTTFRSIQGQAFELTDDFTMGASGYGYVKVRSVSTGSATNVDANTINKVQPVPTGHIAVTNEFKATGGRDLETDEDLRNRLYSHNNKISQKTLAYIAEILRLTNEDVLFVQNFGFDDLGLLNVSVVLQNGVDQTQNELDSLLDASQGYFCLTDVDKQGDVLGIKLVNPTWHEVGGASGIDFRVDLYDNYDPDQVRKNIQIAMSRYFDIRTWTDDNRVEWDDLLQIVKESEGVRYVPDEFFIPGEDEIVQSQHLPRIKVFIMRDIDGNIISDNNGVLSPIFYSIR